MPPSDGVVGRRQMGEVRGSRAPGPASSKTQARVHVGLPTEPTAGLNLKMQRTGCTQYVCARAVLIFREKSAKLQTRKTLT